MEEVFISGTFGGETASLAAAKVALNKIEQLNVPQKLDQLGRYLLDGLNSIIVGDQCQHFAKTAGHPSWSFLLLNDCNGYSSFELKTLYMQEMFKRGILTLGTHNLSYAHTKADIDYLLKCYQEVLPIINEAIANKNLLAQLNCQPLEPLFKVR